MHNNYYLLIITYECDLIQLGIPREVAVINLDKVWQIAGSLEIIMNPDFPIRWFSTHCADCEGLFFLLKTTLRHNLTSQLLYEQMRQGWGVTAPHKFMQMYITHLPPEQDGRHFADDKFKCIFMNNMFCILTSISLTFVLKGPNGNKSVLVQLMAWRQTGGISGIATNHAYRVILFLVIYIYTILAIAGFVWFD